jgi:hypothetical protein
LKNILVIFVLCHLAGGAQEYYNDAQLRTHLAVEKKINKHFSAQIKQQNRFNQNFSNFYRASADLGLIWKLNKNFRFRADYVFIQRKTKEGSYKTLHWYYAALIYKGEVQRWRFLYRNKFQVRTYPNENSLTKLYDRNMITVKYEATKRFTPYLAVEIYIPLNSPQSKGIDRSRTYAGLEIKTARNQQLEFYFMYQAYLTRNNWYEQKNSYPNSPPKRDYVYGISYSIEL